MLMPEEHCSVSFSETECAEQPGFTVLEADGEITVAGACPTCDGPTSMTFQYGSPQGYKGPFRRAPAPLYTQRKVTVYCACGYPHADRPIESPENGCGAYWLVDLG